MPAAIPKTMIGPGIK